MPLVLATRALTAVALTRVALTGVALTGGVLTGCPSTREIPPDATSDVGFDAGPPEANGLDLLLMIDNSNSMAEEHANLLAELPRLFQVLASGDRDGDGAVDMGPVGSIHVGVVTSDMGAGPNTGVPTCARGLGDDGILRQRSRMASARCMASYPSGIFEFDATDSGADFAATLECLGQLGTGGCGFEQQLEAALKAVSPISATEWTVEGYAPPRFVSADGLADTAAGQGQGPNDGFLRPDSALAIVLVTDEEDCSVRDYDLFVTGDPRFMSVPLNLRCNTFGEHTGMGIIHPVVRYVDGFVGLRRDARMLAFSVIAGIPPETEADAQVHDYSAVLASAGMTPRPNAMGTNLEPSCATANGVAYPPIRIVQTAAGLHMRGAQVTMSSICAASFQPAIDRLIASLAPMFPRR